MLEFYFNQTLPCVRPRQLYSCFHLTLDYPHFIIVSQVSADKRTKQ